MVYYGFWFCPKFDALLAFNKEAQKNVTGSVELELYKGNITISKRSSPNSLYDEAIASMEGGGSYNQDDAEGFLRGFKDYLDEFRRGSCRGSINVTTVARRWTVQTLYPTLWRA